MSLNDDSIAAQLNAMKELGIVDDPSPISDKPMRVPIEKGLRATVNFTISPKRIKELRAMGYRVKEKN